MEVLFNKVNDIQTKNYKVNNVNKPVKTEAYSFQGKDELEISSTGKDFSLAMQNLKEIPNVREDVVAEYKAKISKGEYKISPNAIAEKLVNNWIG